MKEISLKTQYLPVEALILHDNNPRNIKDAQFKTLCESIKKNPDYFETRPILCNKAMVVFAGNMRLRAAKEIGLNEVPVIIMDISKERENELMIRDNVQNGAWDYNMLSSFFEPEELTSWGMESAELYGHLPPKVDERENKIPEKKEEASSKLGDLYEIGPHRILVGDCTLQEHAAKLMAGEKAELLFTSPPYSDMRDYNGEKNLSVDNLKHFISAFKPFVKYQCVNLGIQRKDGQVFRYWDSYIDAAEIAGLKLLSWNVWRQDGAGSIGKQTAFFPIEHEWIFVFGTEFKDINRTEERAQNKRKRASTHREKDGTMKEHSVGRQDDLKELGTVLECPSEKGNIRDDHPAVFPVFLPEKYAMVMTNEGDIIVDAFLGSGSTAIACEKTKRRCYGMELDPSYADVAVKRLLNYNRSLTLKKNGIEVDTEPWLDPIDEDEEI